MIFLFLALRADFFYRYFLPLAPRHKKSPDFPLLCGFCAQAVTSVALVAGLTGCPNAGDVVESIGKDYFYGTWVTTEYDESKIVTEASATQILDVSALEENKNDGFYHYYTYKYGNEDQYAVVIWQFDGTSENLLAKDESGFNGGTFRQRIIVYSDSALTTVVKDNLALGGYKLVGNSDYSRGKLYLAYEYLIIGANAFENLTSTEDLRDDLFGKFWGTYKDNGARETAGWSGKEIMSFAISGAKYNKDGDYTKYTPTGQSDKVDVTDDILKDWLKFTNGKVNGVSFKQASEMKDADLYSMRNTADGTGASVWVYVKNEDEKLKFADIEYFRFLLENSGSTGYTRMKATSKAKDNTAIGKIYSQWINEDDYTAYAGTKKIGKYSSKYGAPIYGGTSWTGGDTRYMGKYSIRNKSYLYTSTKSNDELFKNLEDNDTTDYSNPDSEEVK